MRELNADGGWTNVSVSVEKDLQVIDEVKKTHPDTVFLPVFITDWYANSWITGDWLIELIKWFKWLSMMVWIGVDEGYLNFKRGTLNYTINVERNIEKIKITAVAESDKATVTGDGEKTLKTGDNRFEINVFAENGSKRTYVVTVNRKDDRGVAII